MILRRLGNKSKIAHKIQEYFPPHNVYIELFFGAGGMFFNKPKVKYNFLNDIDNDVYNLFMVLKNNSDDLYERVKNTPKHEAIFKHWKDNKEPDPVWRAVRFLYLSNYSLYGKGDTLHNIVTNSKNILLKSIKSHIDIIQDCNFTNCDFREMFGKLAWRGTTDIKTLFIYADPPYIETGTNKYEKFKESDSLDLFDILQDSNIKFAMSEFKNPFIIDEAEKRGLHVVEIAERRTIKNRNIEILVMNYEAEGRMF